MASYRSERFNSKALADDALWIDINRLVRDGLAGRATTGRFNLGWTFRGQEAGNIAVAYDVTNTDAAHLTLIFSVKVRATGQSHDYRQHVRLSYTRQRLGGIRWWMHCPLTGRRVGKLYCPSGAHLFASRQYHSLAYASQREADRDKPFERLRRLQLAMGLRPDFEMPPRRPKAMWRSTYAPLAERYTQLQDACYRELDAAAAIVRR